MNGIIIKEISKKKKINDSEYEYEINAEKITAGHSNLGSKICIKDINDVPGLLYIKEIILERLSGNVDKTGRESSDCIIFKEPVAPSDTIKIITSKNIDNYRIEFPEAEPSE